MPSNDKASMGLKKRWKRYRLKYYFVMSVLLFLTLVIVNLVFIHRYFK